MTLPRMQLGCAVAQAQRLRRASGHLGACQTRNSRMLSVDSQQPNGETDSCPLPLHCGRREPSSEAAHMLCQMSKDSVGVSLPCASQTPHLTASPRAAAAAAAGLQSTARVEAVPWDPPLVWMCHQGPARGFGTDHCHHLLSSQVCAFIGKKNRVEALPHVAVRTLVSNVAPVKGQQLGRLLPAGDCADQRVESNAGEHGSQQTTPY